MEQITADRYYIKAQEFIQKNIVSVPSDLVQKFTEYYDSLTKENAQQVYGEVVQLYNNHNREITLQFNWSMLKFSGGVLLTGSAIALTSYLIDKVVSPKNRFLEYTTYFGCGLMALGVCFGLAVGH